MKTFLNFITDIAAATVLSLGFNMILMLLLDPSIFRTSIFFVAAFLFGFNIRKINDKILGRK